MKTPNVKNDSVLIRGYAIAFRFPTALGVAFSLFVVGFLFYRSVHPRQQLVVGVVFAAIILILILLHSPTRIQFTKDRIRISYKRFPWKRSRNLSSLEKIYIDDYLPISDSGGGGFVYLVLSFRDAPRIKVIIDHLSLKERQDLTLKLSVLRSRFSEYVISEMEE